jgi:hypothetical protein
MSASTAAKFNACTKPRTILCGSLSDAKRMAPSFAQWLPLRQIERMPPNRQDDAQSNIGIDWCET